MIVFPHELARFLREHADEQFDTNTCSECPAAQYLMHADPSCSVVTVTAKRIRVFRGGVAELHETSDWLAAFIREVDLQGGLNTVNQRTITGAQALAILETCV